jgi:hypothetical protein
MWDGRNWSWKNINDVSSEIPQLIVYEKQMEISSQSCCEGSPSLPLFQSGSGDKGLFTN